MSDENAKKAISDVSHALEMWFGSQLAAWPDNPTKYFGTPAREAVMAGRASRDAEVERLQAEVKSLRANWENECGNLEMAERKVESLRQQLAERDAVIERVRAVSAPMQNRLDEYGERPLRWVIRKVCEALAAPSSTLDALIREKQAEALEAFKGVVRGEGEPQHGGEWVSVNHVEDLLDERAAEYRNGADHE